MQGWRAGTSQYTATGVRLLACRLPVIGHRLPGRRPVYRYGIHQGAALVQSCLGHFTDQLWPRTEQDSCNKMNKKKKIVTEPFGTNRVTTSHFCLSHPRSIAYPAPRECILSADLTFPDFVERESYVHLKVSLYLVLIPKAVRLTDSASEKSFRRFYVSSPHFSKQIQNQYYPQHCEVRPVKVALQKVRHTVSG
ncbi:hypothetical protein BaRGS_00009214, partial [Batillaria attramentaria]